MRLEPRGRVVSLWGPYCVSDWELLYEGQSTTGRLQICQLVDGLEPVGVRQRC